MAGRGIFPKAQYDIIYFEDYNAIRTIINPVIGTGSGTTGYGATPVSEEVIQNQAIGPGAWAGLRTDINNCLLHQKGTTVYTGSLSIPTLSGSIKAADVNSFKDAATVAVANKDLVAAGETALVTGLSSTYKTAWNTQISGQFTYQFVSAAAMRNFYNAGGNVRLTVVSDNAGSGGVSASKDSNWHTLITGLGAIYFTKANYTTALAAGAGTAGSNIVVKAQTFGSGVYATNYFQAWGHMTTATRIVFSYICSDASTTTRAGAPIAYDEFVTIGLTGSADYYRSFPSIQGPVPSVTTTQALGSSTITLPAGFLTIAPTTLVQQYEGQTVTITFTGGNGTGPFTFSVFSGSLPSGLTLSSAGVITGTLTAASKGTFNFVIKVVDSVAAQGYQNYTLLIGGALSLSPNTPYTLYTGENRLTQLNASGGTAPYTFSVVSGSIPGRTLSTSGLWSGAPTTVGTYPMVVQVTDSSSPNNSVGGPYDQIVLAGLTMSPAAGALTGGTRGATYSVQLSTANGTSPYTYALTAGSLPLGLSLSTGGLISGRFTGTGNASFTITATDSTSPTVRTISSTYTIAVVAATITITPLNETFTTGDVVDTVIGTSGAYGTVNITASGSITGMTFSKDGNNARLQGLAGNNTSFGTYTLSLTATDQYGNSRTQTYTQVVNQYVGKWEKVINFISTATDASTASIPISSLGGGGYGTRRRIVIPLWVGQQTGTSIRPVTSATMVLNGTTYNFTVDAYHGGSGRLWCAIMSCMIPEGAEDGASNIRLNLTFSGTVGHKNIQVYAVATGASNRDATAQGNGAAATSGIDLKFSNSKLFSVEFRTFVTFRTGGSSLNYNMTATPAFPQNYDNSPVNGFDGGDWSGCSGVFSAADEAGQFLGNPGQTGTAYALTKVFSAVNGTGYSEVAVRYT